MSKSDDTIRRQDAINAVTRAIWHYPNECYKNLNVYEVAETLVSDAINLLPSADRPEIVYCKDCKWSESNHSDQDGYFCHHNRHNPIWQEFSHDFCSHGERKEDENGIYR